MEAHECIYTLRSRVPRIHYLVCDDFAADIEDSEACVNLVTYVTTSRALYYRLVKRSITQLFFLIKPLAFASSLLDQHLTPFSISPDCIMNSCLLP